MAAEAGFSDQNWKKGETRRSALPRAATPRRPPESTANTASQTPNRPSVRVHHIQASPTSGPRKKPRS